MWTKNLEITIQRLFLIDTHEPVFEGGERGPNLFLTLFQFVKTHLIIDYKVVIDYNLKLIAYYQDNYRLRKLWHFLLKKWHVIINFAPKPGYV